jgi:hypothetical protein
MGWVGVSPALMPDQAGRVKPTQRAPCRIIRAVAGVKHEKFFLDNFIVFGGLC